MKGLCGHMMPILRQSGTVGVSGAVCLNMPPKLQFLHSKNLLNAVKLSLFRSLSTDEIKSSLRLGQPGCLKARPDGTVLDGHHRLSVLMERDEDVHTLPREIMEKHEG